MSDKDIHPNSLLIPKEEDSSRRSFPGSQDHSRPSASIANRFDVLPSNAMKRRNLSAPKEEKKIAKANTAGAAQQDASDSLSAYQKMRMDREEAIKQEIRNRNNPKPPSPEEQKRAQEKKDTEQRVQARQLQTDLTYWKQQKGQGLHDDGTVDGMVSDIQRQLGMIEPKYW